MKEDTILMVGALAAGGYLLYKFITPSKVTQAETNVYTQKAAEARDTDTWFAPMANTQAIIERGKDYNTTYFLTAADYNAMTRWQRLLYSWNVPLSKIFG